MESSSYRSGELSFVSRSPTRWSSWSAMRPSYTRNERAPNPVEMRGVQSKAARRTGGNQRVTEPPHTRPACSCWRSRGASLGGQCTLIVAERKDASGKSAFHPVRPSSTCPGH